MTKRSGAAPLLLTFAAGVLVGGAGVYAYLMPQRDLERPRASAPPPVADAPLPPQGSGIVAVTLSSGNVDLRGSGVAVAGDNVVIVPLAGFRPSDSGRWRGADGRRRELDSAVAWDFDLGLAVFDVGDAGRDGLELSPEDGSLYLGLELDILTSDGRRDGFVDSPAIAGENGGYTYNVNAATPGNLRAGALLEPGTRMLLGLALPPDGTPRDRSSAIDAGALRDLIAMRSRVAPLTVAELSAAYLRSFAGLRATLRSEFDAGRWGEAVTAAETLSRLHGDRIDPQSVVYAMGAYVKWTQEQLDAGVPTRAVQIANRAESTLGARATLRLNLARALIGSGDTNGAIRVLQSYLADHPRPTDDGSWLLLRDELRALVVREASRDTLSAPLAIDLLERAVRIDDYAAYHRHLGERLYQQGRYVEAERSLGRAVELDPSYAAELQGTLQESRQRRSTASLIEVPLQSLGNAIFVTVRLNNRPELYTFLLDTGATYSAINMRTLLRLGLENVLASSGTPVQLETANGTVSAGSIRLDSINLAGAIVEQVPVVVLEELDDIDGLLGLSFLSHFDIEINQRDSKLLLTPR